MIKKYQAEQLSVFLKLLLVATIFDGLSTIVGVSLGAMEQNPFIAGWVTPEISIAIRIVIISIIFYWGVEMRRTNLFINMMIALAGIATMFVALGNVGLVIFILFNRSV